MKNKLYFFIVFILISLITACYKKNLEYESLLQVPEHEKNWIPLFLSQTESIMNQVHNYYENHDLDTNETWGYFSIDKNLSYLREYNCIYDIAFFNKEKLEKKIKRLGCKKQIDSGNVFQYENILYFIIFDDKDNKFYFFGKYR